MSGRVGRTVGAATLQATGRYVRRQLWLWPIVAAVALGTVGWWVSSSLESAMRQQRIEDLTTILEADTTALNVWMDDQQHLTELIARDPALRALVEALTAAVGEVSDPARALLLAVEQDAVRAQLAAPLEQLGYSGFMVVDPTGMVMAADQDAPIGRSLGGYSQETILRALAEGPLISRPYPSPLLLTDEKGNLRANLPTMFAAAPIRDDGGEPIAVLGLQIRPEAQFTEILQTARAGRTGETFAFDRDGLLLSESRFDEDLKQIGLLVDDPDVRSVLAIELRDPETDMTRGYRPALRRHQQPLTVTVARAIEGGTGYDVDGYRDYRGVPVVGAWTWLPEHDFGVATEIEVAEAFRPVYILRTTFRVMMGLLLLSAVGVFAAMVLMARQQRALQQATLAARQLGQYRLEERIGSGGMGTVYRARHAMLRRPTAIKLLNLDNTSDAALTRFEREVQLTSQLSHPNTVAIFDYGRTPDGIFYYVMEYLEGLSLEDLIEQHGPVEEARALHLLRQICGALAEAHAQGLVHRDIKPANIVLTTRGGISDFVKVLDFGLVKIVAGPSRLDVTSANAVTGTPLYLSPEAVHHPELVDARSDVYAIGLIGYYLLAGSPPFHGATVLEICMKHLQTTPETPSHRLGRPISPSLERVLLRCLAKSQAERPTDAAALLRELDDCEVVGSWTPEDAAAWWRDQGPPVEMPVDPDTPDERLKRSAPAAILDMTMVQ